MFPLQQAVLGALRGSNPVLPMHSRALYQISYSHHLLPGSDSLSADRQGTENTRLKFWCVANYTTR